ncbi:High potential iron-sulfur protein [Chitinophaga ginsengisegetis]|uniref:High-potential iron-sulfur protein n=1 Tax=Chitinophaga ginsengisegetis TaxID=393003 RepID=A0A1T5PBP9_9BACT|nr:high-potential iron-sulfur protein [Chitinophaga ginsengisegetis]SKD10027.1 High potential iron-sulfur protein [Chitinophaga ginsengisegetis]
MNEIERRQFIKNGILFSASFLAGGLLLLGCGNSQKENATGDRKAKEEKNDAPAKDPCDASALSAEDLKARKALGYVDQTPMKEKRCGNCKLFVPAQGEKSCNTCPLFKGPVSPKGYCTYWAPKGI